MRRVIIILIISILGLGISSCRQVASEIFERGARGVGKGVGREAGERAARGVGREAGERAARGVGREAGERAIQRNNAQRIVFELSTNSKLLPAYKKVDEEAYQAALIHLNSVNQEVSLKIAENIALEAAKQTNKELGNQLTEVQVTATGIFAGGAAYTYYQANNS